MADEQEPGELKRVPLRERSRQWFLTIGTALALLTTIIGFLSDSVGVWEFLQSNNPFIEPTVEVVPRPAVVGSDVQTPTAIVSPVPTLTPAPTITPTITPLPVAPAVDERLLLVAQFTNFTVDANYNVAGRIHEALDAAATTAQLEDTRVETWPEAINSPKAASDLLNLTRATLVIWGEYDSGRVSVRFTSATGGEDDDWQRLLGGPTELSTTINLEVPREAQALALIALGRLYRAEGDVARARAAFAQALAQQPGDEGTVATLRFYLAAQDAEAQPPDLDRAIDGYSSVIEMRPEWVNARYNRGLAYLTRYWRTAAPADLDSALADFSWTIEAQEEYTQAYINRAIAYYARNGSGDLEASLADSTTALRYSPLSFHAYYNRGLAYIRLAQQADWEHDLNRALEIAPQHWATHHALCWGYALEQEPETGLPHCDEAANHDSSGSTLDGRGLIFAQLGRLDEAAADLTRYLAWLDTQPRVWSELNHRRVYEEILAGLEQGENRITTELLEQLR